MNTEVIILNRVITPLVGKLLDEGFNATEVPEHHKNETISSRLPKDYSEYKVMYKEDIVCYIQVWESPNGSVKVSLWRMLPEFDKVPNTRAIEKLVEVYNELVYV